LLNIYLNYFLLCLATLIPRVTSDWDINVAHHEIVTPNVKNALSMKTEDYPSA